jgi:hypothetical protein
VRDATTPDLLCAAYEDLSARLRADMPSQIGLANALATDEPIDDTTKLRRTRDMYIRELGGTVIIQSGTTSTGMPIGCLQALRFIARRRIFLVGQVPGPLTASARMSLCKKLSTEGIVVRVT